MAIWFRCDPGISELHVLAIRLVYLACRVQVRPPAEGGERRAAGEHGGRRRGLARGHRGEHRHLHARALQARRGDRLRRQRARRTADDRRLHRESPVQPEELLVGGVAVAAAVAGGRAVG